jgi:anti-anti-sigma factor
VSADGFSVQEHDEAGVRVIAVTGELDIATAPDLCARLDANRGRGQPRMLVDLTAVDFCDSTGVRALLDVVGASEWMVIHTDPESGLAALVSPPPRAV